MFSPDQLRQRFIAFDSLEYSTDAFIDYRIPGCGPKKNYALIGAGVSQNPDQPVALQETHGFQVGGVSMPAGVVNPPHMHFTAEVFICTNGRWELHWGFNPDAGVASFGEGVFMIANIVDVERFFLVILAQAGRDIADIGLTFGRCP